jgi:hypothetical protein
VKKWYEQQSPEKPEATPHLLQHPNLPKPMHGQNPRSILGKQWWDDHRFPAYAERDFHCWACGVHKSEAAVHQWLEGHEEYKIDYAAGRMEFVRVVALCHFCHNFIHSGRLYMLWYNDEIDRKRFKAIITHGFDVLRDAGLLPWSGTIETVLLMAEEAGWGGFGGWQKHHMLKLLEQAKSMEGPEGTFAAWGDWRLVLEGKEYPPVHASFEDWREAYGR